MKTLVWDLPLRLFHWLLALSVTGALVTISLGGNWMVWHERCGLAVIGLLAFRLVWGLCGSTHSRFASFFPTPARLKAYISGNWQHQGHNPIGAFSVFALLGLMAFQAVTGLFSNDDSPLRPAEPSSFQRHRQPAQRLASFPPRS
ncbi:cytochrome b/b6 domain-containing protein [Halopseudomonas pachastrellae]|nr:cytochrome b/b6 domain-containing protein [Halopseudomonas pachastrellae]